MRRRPEPVAPRRWPWIAAAALLAAALPAAVLADVRPGDVITAANRLQKDDFASSSNVRSQSASIGSVKVLSSSTDIGTGTSAPSRSRERLRLSGFASTSTSRRV